MLKSEHITLSPLMPADMPVMFNWINDREQVLLNSSYKPVSQIQHQTWFDGIQQQKDAVIFGIRLLETDKLIGSCQLHSINYIHRNAEMQIRLGEISERNHGYGTEAIQLLLQFAFNDLNLQRVYLHVFDTNAVAIHIYEKLGFVREGILRQAAYINGQYVDTLLMSILREEYVGS